ncbi:ABC transporter substrate-binding protein [Maridesulfovibrio sp. FT414]|uniref:ABC transporter substrate-binding protein n=1 Tax=Maridesulfovibrio sp. FT414 TaxID=2979469 RepID=UPI003D80396F
MERRRFVLAALVLLVGLAVASCSDSPIIIGYSATLKGKYSDLGVQGRNGALLAIEEINAAGGVDGRKLELLVRDDGNTPEGAIKADTELLAAGASVILGHMTSAQSMAALEKFKDSEVVYLSPTTSTDLLQGKKDNFFRVISTLTDLARSLARHSVGSMGSKRMAVVWDRSNAPFTGPYKDSFLETFRENGGEVVGEVGYESSKGPVDWQGIVDQLKGMQPDSVVVACAARDLAAFAQHLRLNGVDWNLFSSMWGYTKELIQTGGKSVEGIVFAVHFVEDRPEPGYAEFEERFISRFGWAPNFAAVFSYEAVRVFVHAVKKNGGSTKGLDKVLPGMVFEGTIIGTYELDDFGDVKREGHIVKVKDGEFVTVTREAQ